MARILLFFVCMPLLLISIPLSGHTGFYPTTWIQYKLGLDAASIHEECQHYLSSDSLLINCYIQKFKPLVNFSLWVYMLSYSVILYLAATGSDLLRKILLMFSIGLTLYYVFSSGISSVGFVGNLMIALVFGVIILRNNIKCIRAIFRI